MTKERWSRLRVNENYFGENKTNKGKWLQINRDSNYTFLLGRVNTDELSKGDMYTLKVDFELRNVNILEGERLIVRTQSEGNVQGWTGVTPNALTPIMKFIDDLKDGEITLQASFRVAESLTDDFYTVYCRVDNVTTGEIRLKRAKFEDGEEPTLYIPHRNLLTTEQQNLLKYGEYEQIQSF